MSRISHDRKSRAIVIAQHATRGVLVCLIVGLAYSLQPRPIERPSQTDAPGPPPALETMAGLADGSWQLAHVPWMIASHVVRSDALEPRLSARSDAPLPAEAPAIESSILSYFRQYGRMSNTGPSITYDWTNGAVRVVAIAVNSTIGERLQVVRLALPEGASQWRVHELQLSASMAGPPPAELLPLPAGCDRVARRLDPNGRICGEASLYASSPEAIVDGWTSQGWMIERLGGARAGGTHLVCRRDGQTRWVWLSRPAHGARGLVVVQVAQPSA